MLNRVINALLQLQCCSCNGSDFGVISYRNHHSNQKSCPLSRSITYDWKHCWLEL